MPSRHCDGRDEAGGRRRTGRSGTWGGPAPCLGLRSALTVSLSPKFSRIGGPNPAAWIAAVTAAEQAGEPYTTAYARWRVADALLSAREARARAGDELRRAFEAATQLGAAPLADKIEAPATRARIQLLVTTAEELSHAAPAGSEVGLSECELEVLALVGHGRTDRQSA
jgi:hypothetical protein